MLVVYEYNLRSRHMRHAMPDEYYKEQQYSVWLLWYKLPNYIKMVDDVDSISQHLNPSFQNSCEILSPQCLPLQSAALDEILFVPSRHHGQLHRGA